MGIKDFKLWVQIFTLVVLVFVIMKSLTISTVKAYIPDSNMVSSNNLIAFRDENSLISEIRIGGYFNSIYSQPLYLLSFEI